MYVNLLRLRHTYKLIGFYVGLLTGYWEKSPLEQYDLRFSGGCCLLFLLLIEVKVISLIGVR